MHNSTTPIFTCGSVRLITAAWPVACQLNIVHSGDHFWTEDLAAFSWPQNLPAADVVPFNLDGR